MGIEFTSSQKTTIKGKSNTATRIATYFTMLISNITSILITKPTFTSSSNEPTVKNEGDLWYKDNVTGLQEYINSTWVPVTTLSNLSILEEQTSVINRLTILEDAYVSNN